MGLNACVYCDCLEKGRLRKPLPADFRVKVEADGMPCIIKGGEVIWDVEPAAADFLCDHEGRILIHHYLGNMALIGVLRRELDREASVFPLLLQKVVYNGIHGGDWIGIHEFPQLQVELKLLEWFKCAGNVPTNFLISFDGHPPAPGWKQEYSTPEESGLWMQIFRKQMLELVDVALRIGKPISF